MCDRRRAEERTLRNGIGVNRRFNRLRHIDPLHGRRRFFRRRRLYRLRFFNDRFFLFFHFFNIIFFLKKKFRQFTEHAYHFLSSVMFIVMNFSPLVKSRSIRFGKIAAGIRRLLRLIFNRLGRRFSLNGGVLKQFLDNPAFRRQIVEEVDPLAGVGDHGLLV